MSTVLRSAITLLAGIAIFVGLPLVGWGVMDVHGFIGHPARLGYIVLVVLLHVFVVIKISGVGRNRGKGEKTVPLQRWTLVLIQVQSLAIVLSGPYSDRREFAVLGDMEFVRYMGLGLFALGFLLAHWAEFRLGKQFSVEVTIQEDHRLVTDAPYRYMRHPRYLGIILFTAGISLTFRSWLALMFVAALTLVLLGRMHVEEALLHREFGKDWEAYCQRSWRLIPFVY